MSKRLIVLALLLASGACASARPRFASASIYGAAHRVVAIDAETIAPVPVIDVSPLLLVLPGEALPMPDADAQSTLTVQPLIAPSRRIDWTHAGATIVSRSTICVTAACNTMTAAGTSATVAQINSAIGSADGSNTVVLLTTGTYNLAGGITFNGSSSVTLRGAGPDATKLVFTNDTSCQGQRANVCIMGNDLGYYGPGPPTNIVNWTSGYTAGSTSIVVSATTGLSTGMYIYLDQTDDTSCAATDSICTCLTETTCTGEGGGGNNARTGRSLRQMVKVTNIAGTTLTITPGVYPPNFNGGQTPQAWWGNSSSLSHDNGIEDLSVDASAGQATNAAITVAFSYNSWLKHLRVLYGPSPRAIVELYQTSRITVRDSYLYGSVADAGSSTNYGIEETGGNADSLVENNIVQHRTSPFVRDGAMGSIYGYNYAIDDHYTASATFMQAANYSHQGQNMFVLDEGNVSIGLKDDVVHSPSNLLTAFRNYFIGWETGRTQETGPVKLYAFQRFRNLVGNVLGRSGYHTTYEAAGTGGSSVAIYAFGMPGQNTSFVASPADTHVATTVFRWGNYDTQTGTSRFVASEVPSSIATLPNPVPIVTSLPASLYLSAKPPFFGSVRWPPIGPDVTGGDVSNVGGHVFKTPAQLCFESLSDDLGYAADDEGTRPKHFTSGGACPS
jgi:hypothetical protein